MLTSAPKTYGSLRLTGVLRVLKVGLGRILENGFSLNNIEHFMLEMPYRQAPS